ncbi:30S ribosomal protein S2 [Candidatus Falkowbacteria bacterium]|jgi:small subunit ribosomal protein S2|nr:30S ribosomal protein S2 [Candidatus Falkowbacteria bacterium]MBT6573848.1 30S ribosomal protein S2 [Candidatus Falkowbacteria bacterium]MBT7348538.1 30S ribosomal protein S2 [Candidatus Falkowbacteria bacterium]MBT7501078.1 30S ribosomal protein S2 [Candidatus Falkowbacteria bacterium]
MSIMPSLQDLMKAGVHFGHQRSNWHPKMERFIFTEKSGLHIINLEETLKELEHALDFVKQTVANGGTVLFLGTKKQAQEIVKEAAIDCKMPYIVHRWLGGTLTNSDSVLGVVKKYRKLKEDTASGAIKRYTKKEQLKISREIARLDVIVGGIESLTRVPDAIFIVDMKCEKTALKEAQRKNIPIVSICDTNNNPENADYPIPGNDDATSSIKLLVNIVKEAVKEGQKMVKAPEVKKPEPVKSPSGK